MRALTIGVVAATTLLTGLGAAFAQSFEVGPGGVRVYPDRPRVYEERRIYDERPRYGDDRRLCARLRDACEYGDRGEGNCRRYRRTCG